MIRKLTLGLCALALALTGVACGDDTGGGGSAPESLNALTAAAEKATDAGSSRMTMDMSMNFGGQELSVEGEGVFDYDDRVGEMTMSITGAGLPSAQSIDMIVDGDFLYMKAPPSLGAPGWTRMDMSEIPGGTNQFSQDPSQYLDFLRGAGEDVEEVGTEEIDGVETTHYEADLSLDAILEQAPEGDAEALRSQLEALGGGDTIPSEVWIDEDGLPRRIKLTMHVESDGQSADMDITMGLSDYGIEVDVEPPEDYEEISAPTS